MNTSKGSENDVSTQGNQPVNFPISYWLISIIALLWNSAGIFMFTFQITLTPEVIALMPIEQQPLYQNIPLWVTICFGLATIGGTLGSIMLLLKKRWALILFVISTFSVVGQNIYNWLISDAINILGAQVIIMPIVIIAINVFLVWFSHYSIQQGRLR